MSKKKSRMGPPQIYPWESWLKSGYVFKLNRGVDYKCLTRSMLTTLYQTAKERGWRLSVKEGEHDVLVVTVLGRRKKSA